MEKNVPHASRVGKKKLVLTYNTGKTTMPTV